MKYSIAVMALLGLLSHAEIVEAKHHHHNHLSLAQAQDDAPKGNPDASRKSFEKHRAEAASVVATQQAFESTKTADVAARNAANTKETWDKKAHVRTNRVDQTWGGYPHRQWVLRDKKRDVIGTGYQVAQTSTPDDSRKAWEESRASARDVVAHQYKQNDSWDIAVANAQEKHKQETFDEKKGVRDARVNQTRGGVKAARDSFGWRAQISGNPENSYKEKADSLKEVLQTTKTQRAYERKSNADVEAAQEKYKNQTENQKNGVRIARRIQANGGLNHQNSLKVPSSLAQSETPDASRKSFEEHVKTAANVVSTQQAYEVKKTADVAAANALDIKNTYHKKAHDRAGRVAMMRGGPASRYGGGHRAQVGAWESDSDSDSDSGSDSE